MSGTKRNHSCSIYHNISQIIISHGAVATSDRQKGAEHYGERNVDKGIPQHSLIDSGLRHLFKYLRGDKDENHLVAALWNIAWAVEQEVNKP